MSDADSPRSWRSAKKNKIIDHGTSRNGPKARKNVGSREPRPEDPQQGWQPRPEERPAVAVAHTPNSLDRWKERFGRRRDKQPGDSLDGGWDKWTAAVAASPPMKVGTYDARHEMPMKVAPRSWSDEEPQCPASALREVMRREASLLD